MKYRQSIDYLYGLTLHGIKLGLDNTRVLLGLLSDPEKSFMSIHIAGTNGKGSTAAMLSSLLLEAGLKVGIFTSPHILSFTERIQVNGKQVSEEEVVRLTDRIRRTMEGVKDLKPTFFEFVTAMAFLYFRERGVQWAVIETGMGGRFDATNILTPDVTVITSVGHDHKEFLGETIEEIAFEKAG
ncbi:MAG TPA: bifunctional folylpolyglutamate synthase/dihydrofolate synthase, partial [Nitrospirae bacterium]|nr:bifunctional folylpolyglutamate synthase/dihydrofolate synthase [Nitrospirota bacterium]